MKRPACLQRQTGACRSCGLAVSQPCRGHEEPVETTDALRPTGGGRGAGCTLSFVSNGESDRLPTAVPVPSDGSDQLQSLNGCPTGEGLITPTAGLDRGRRTSVNSVVSARAACEGPASTPLRQHSLVGDRGRANHPPVMPVQQGPRTQVSMVGNLGESQTAQSLSPGPAPGERACRPPSADCRQSVHKS